MKQLDFATAFLNSSLNEKIYLEIPPPCFDLANKDNFVWKLNKALYGLDNAAKVLNDTLKKFLKENNYFAFKSCPCILVNERKDIYILVYVDDLLIASHDLYIVNECIKLMCSKFNVTVGRCSSKILRSSYVTR